jgi:hypothetical protein
MFPSATTLACLLHKCPLTPSVVANHAHIYHSLCICNVMSNSIGRLASAVRGLGSVRLFVFSGPKSAKFPRPAVRSPSSSFFFLLKILLSTVKVINRAQRRILIFFTVVWISYIFTMLLQQVTSWWLVLLALCRFVGRCRRFGGTFP